jgi:hypothetical protein
VLFDNLCGEFEAAWDMFATSDIADRPDGRFLFTRAAMLLVELASTVAHRDPATFRRFSQEPQKREPLLFKRLPYKSGSKTRRRVPRLAPDGDQTSEIIEVLFDLLRNGHAHFGHPLYAPLKDGGGSASLCLASRTDARSTRSARQAAGRSSTCRARSSQTAASS